MEKTLERILALKSFNRVNEVLSPLSKKKISKLFQKIIALDYDGYFSLRERLTKIKDEMYEFKDNYSNNYSSKNNSFEHLFDEDEDEDEDEIDENENSYDQLANNIFQDVDDNNELIIDRYLEDLFRLIMNENIFM